PTRMPPNPKETAIRIPPATTKGIMYETPLSSASLSRRPSRLTPISTTFPRKVLADLLHELIWILDDRVRGHRERLALEPFEAASIGQTNVVGQNDDVGFRDVRLGQSILDP